MDDRSLRALAREQDCVLSLTDAASLGMSPEALSQHARRHAWTRPHPGVVLLPGAALTYRRAVLVALKAAGGQRVLASGRTAAHLWGGSVQPPRVIELLVPADRHDTETGGLRLDVEDGRRSFRAPVQVRRSRTLTRGDALDLEGIPVTTPARTIVDLAAVLDVDALRSLVIDARQRGRLLLADLEAVHRRIARYPGRPRVRHVLADLDEQDCDSRLEWDFRVEARARGLRPHPTPFPFRCSDGVVIEIDVAFPEQWVACECDGLSSRSDRAALSVHHRRQNRAVADGWRPFLIDWTRLKQDADRLFAELAALLAGADQSRPPAPLADLRDVDARYRGRRRRR